MLKIFTKKFDIQTPQTEHSLPKEYLSNKNYTLKAIKIDKIKEHLNYYISWLTKKEYREYLSFRNSKRQHEWLAARVAVKKLLRANKIIEQPQQGEILKGELGAPYINIIDTLFLSISHSHNMAIVAVSTYPIGIDIEYIEPRPNSLCQFFFCPEEQAYLKELPDSDKTLAINRIWTYKEAVSKVLGLGGKMNFRKINSMINQHKDPITQLIIHGQFFIVSNYVITIAQGTTQDGG